MIDIIESLRSLQNSPDLKELQNYILKKQQAKNEKCNIFKILKMDNYEIRHSKFLAWLLNPKANHNLGKTFLEEFLKESLGQYKNIDYNDIQVKTEFPTNKNRRIDILIYSEKSKFVCVIENKYGSLEQREQCKHYKQFIDSNSHFSKFSRNYVFLDIYEPPIEDLNGKLSGYKSITYKQVANIIKRIIDTTSIKTRVLDYLNEYIDVLEEKYPMKDETITALCQQIYTQYADAIETILQTKNDEEEAIKQELFELLKEVLSERADIKICYIGQKNILFLPADINDTKLKFSDIEPDHIIVHIQIINFSYNKCMYIEVGLGGPKDDTEEEHKKRYNLLEHLESVVGKFNKKKDRYWSYTKHIKLINLKEYKDMDYDKSKAKQHIDKTITESGLINKLSDAIKSW